MLDLKGSRFFQAALQSGLIDEAGLVACFELIPPEKRTPDAVDRRLARQAISTGRLTLWQAQQILGGRSTGYKIDKYVLLDLLGRGGMGRVYLAKDVRLNRPVALKVLSQERMNNPRAIARFQREAKVGAQLQHENLVRIYDEGESNGIRYLVMEYIEGKNAGQLIGEQGSIPWPTASRIARQVALGLEHARLKELIHRDVNPCNILVTRDGTAKLTDLGLAIDLNDQENVTRDGATVGTFDYVSPEQAKHSRSVDTRADIYSLGCTLYHMAAGRVPFPVASLPEKLYAHQLHDPDPLHEVAPGVPVGLSEIVRKMMRKAPEERYQTPLEVAQALEPFAAESGWTATATSTAPPLPDAAVALGASTAPVAATSARPKPMPAAAVASTNGRGAVAEVEARPGARDGGDDGSSFGLGLGLEIDLGPGPTPSGSGSGSAGLKGDGRPRSSGSAPGVGDSFFPLDLGPDDPLAEGLKPGPRSRSKSADPDRRRPRFGLVAAGIAAAIIVVAAFAALAILTTTHPGFARPKADADGDRPAKAVRPPTPPKSGEIVVQHRDGESEVVKTLAEALAIASGRSSTSVILGGKATIRVDNSKPIRVSEGDLTLRAADGARPVLEVKLKGSTPMFFVNAHLRIEGLTVVVRRDEAADAPAFQVERDLTLERCTFRSTGPSELSRFAVAEGRKAAVDGCLFEGFETALDVEASPGMTVSIRDSIFLAAGVDEPTGRAIRVHSIYGEGAGSRLSAERCSSRSRVFLEASNFGPATPLDVEVSGSAFLVKSVLGFDGEPKAALGASAAVRWRGRDNRYQVAGPAWAAVPDAPTSLDAWSKLASEVDAKVQPLKLAKTPPDPDSPGDCALLDEDGKVVGASPSGVGPR